MAHEVSNAPVPQDIQQVRFDDIQQIEYWTNRFGVSLQRLRDVVSVVGHDVDAIAEALSE